MKRMDGKVAIVTGSSSGIGKAIALVFGSEGAKVVVAARRTNLCEEVAGRIKQEGGDALAVPTDVSDEAQVEKLIAETVSRYGRLDVMVNNAGLVAGGRIAETKTEAFDRVLQTNLRGTFLCARAGFRQMRKNGGGLIINMSSVAGVQAWTGTGIYSASKFGIMGLTKSMADEGRAHHIKVCAICPGDVADEMVDATPEEIAASGQISPYEIAYTCVYLSTLGPNTIVQQIVMDRMGAEW